LVDRFMAMRLAMDIYPPYFNQAVLADFINEGHFSRHVRRARMLYRERRERLTECLQAVFGSRLQVLDGETGVHLVVTLPPGSDAVDRDISARAAQQKLWLWPLSPAYLGKSPRQGFILGFGSVATDDIPEAVRRMNGVLRGQVSEAGG